MQLSTPAPVAAQAPSQPMREYPPAFRFEIDPQSPTAGYMHLNNSLLRLSEVRTFIDGRQYLDASEALTSGIKDAQSGAKHLAAGDARDKAHVPTINAAVEDLGALEYTLKRLSSPNAIPRYEPTHLMFAELRLSAAFNRISEVQKAFANYQHPAAG